MGSKVWLVLIMVCLMVFPVLGEKSPDESRKVEFLGGSADKPFCEAVRAGNFLILSGQVGVDPQTGKLAPGGIKGETRQTMENIKKTLKKYGSSMERVVKCTVMLADIQEWGEMNKVYITYFPVHKPTRSAFGASGLAMNARVEIECWAVLE